MQVNWDWDYKLNLLTDIINKEDVGLHRDEKRNAQFVQKVTFEPLMDLKQNHFGS